MLSRAFAPVRRMAPVAASAAIQTSAVLPAAVTAHGGQQWGWIAAAAASAGLACCFDAAADDSRDDMLIFTGNANPALAKEIATALKKKLAPADVKSFADGEVSIRVSVSLLLSWVPALISHHLGKSSSRTAERECPWTPGVHCPANLS